MQTTVYFSVKQAKTEIKAVTIRILRGRQIIHYKE